MTDLEKSKIYMYEAVVSLLLENRDIVTLIRPFHTSLNKLRRLIDEIEKKEKELSSQTLSKTIEASKAKEELIPVLSQITSALFIYAKQAGDIKLKEKTRCSNSYFVRLRDSELIDYSSAILNIANKNIASLKKFDITKSHLELLNVKLEQFKNALDNKITGIMSGETVTSITELFVEADNIVSQQMDRYVEILGEEYEEFYDEYLSTRAMESEENEIESLELVDEDSD